MDKELAIQYIKAQRQCVDDLTRKAFDMAIEALETAPCWIPCSKALPTDCSEKFVTFQSGYVSTASFVPREKIYCDGMLVSMRQNFWQVLEGDKDKGQVIAWMEKSLPAPYSGSGNHGGLYSASGSKRSSETMNANLGTGFRENVSVTVSNTDTDGASWSQGYSDSYGGCSSSGESISQSYSASFGQSGSTVSHYNREATKSI